MRPESYTSLVATRRRTSALPAFGSVTNASLVAHEEVGQEAVVRNARVPVVSAMVPAVEVGDRGFGQQVVEQMLVGGDRVEH
jgi:hypothetical protein